MRALSGFIGFKGSVGGLLSQRSKFATAQPWPAVETASLESATEAHGIRGVAVKCLDITKNSDREGIVPGHN